MDGGTLYSKWILAAAEQGLEIEESWDELDDIDRAAWEQLAENLEIDYRVT